MPQEELAAVVVVAAVVAVAAAAAAAAVLLMQAVELAAAVSTRVAELAEELFVDVADAEMPVMGAFVQPVQERSAAVARAERLSATEALVAVEWYDRSSELVLVLQYSELAEDWQVLERQFVQW